MDLTSEWVRRHPSGVSLPYLVLFVFLDQPAVHKLDPPAPHSINKGNVVARDQQCYADFIEAPEYAHDLQREIRIEIARWLVCNQ